MSVVPSKPNRRSLVQLAQVMIATLVVAGCPVVVVWELRAAHITTPLVSLILGVVLSLLMSFAGRVVWEKRPGSEDLLFSELMVWGYMHRWRTQRRLSSARDLVAPMSEHQHLIDDMGVKKRAKLLERLVASMETRDPYLHGHSRRVARHSWMIARRLKLSRAEIARIRTAAAIHDVGKTKTPTAVLHKAGALDEEEYRIIKRHPGDGAEMASVLEDKQLVSMVMHHHERIDGSGYPAGLSATEIPLGARIIAVADTFDAITSARPYRAASPHHKALLILREEAGTRLDPDVVKAFCDHYAGRGPLTLWSLLAGLPERVVSWLGGSIAGVASAAKVAAVTALVAGTAATSATLGLSASGHPRTESAPGGSAPASQSAAVGTVLASASPLTSQGAPSGERSGPPAVRRLSPKHATLALGAGTRTVALLGATASATPAAVQPSTPPPTLPAGAHMPPLQEAPRPAAGKETGAGAPIEEAAAKKAPVKEAPGKAKQEELPVKHRHEEAPAAEKSKEAPAKAKREEAAAGKGKAEEAPVKSTHEQKAPPSEEAPARSKGEEKAQKGEEKARKSEEKGGRGKPEEGSAVTKGEENATGKSTGGPTGQGAGEEAAGKGKKK